MNFLSTLGAKATFSAEEIGELQGLGPVQSIGSFSSNQFKVGAASAALGFYTELFFEAVPDEFLDVQPAGCFWESGKDEVPIILSRDYLALYNFGFAASQGLPKIPFESIPMASKSFFPEPLDEDSLHISLPLEFGQNIFDLILDNDINNDEELREVFKGFSIQPDENDDASVLGFSTSVDRTYVRFFYRIPDEFDDTEETLDLSIREFAQEPKIFNNIQSNVSGTVLDTLTDREINLLSTDSDNRSFIQSGSGYATRIQLPTIKSIFDIPGTGTILSAILEIKPPPNTYNDLVPIRDSLNINIIDQNNTITEQLFFGGQPVYGIIDEEKEEFNELIYQIPIGVYVDRELNETTIIDDAFIIFPSEFNSSVDRIILEGEESLDFSTRLILTYAVYDE